MIKQFSQDSHGVNAPWRWTQSMDKCETQL